MHHRREVSGLSDFSPGHEHGESKEPDPNRKDGIRTELDDRGGGETDHESGPPPFVSPAQDGPHQDDDAERNGWFAEEFCRRLQSHREEPEGRRSQDRHGSFPSQLTSYGEDNDAGHRGKQGVDQGQEQHLVANEFGQRIRRNDKDADADPVGRVGRAEVQVIVECAYRLECEVVREVRTHRDHRVCVICHERMTADREIHEKEAAENTNSDQQISPGTVRRGMTRASANPRSAFSIGACTRLR